MFGSGHTYFADSPVVIDISGLYWGETVTSPFTIVRVEVVPVETSGAEAQLTEMFQNSYAPFYDDALGYINGADIWHITDSNNVTYSALVVTSYSRKGRYGWLENDVYRSMLNNHSVEKIKDIETRVYHRLVELDSSQARCDKLLELCSAAYCVDEETTAIGDFRADTGGQDSISFDISSALRAIWSDYGFGGEVTAAETAINSSYEQQVYRPYRQYSLRIYTEYLDSTDGEFNTTQCEDENGNTLIPGGQSLIGGLTEWERYIITDRANADVSHLEHTGIRNGDASTKPTSSPERVGKTSITSWVDVQEGFTRTIFYPATYNNGQGQIDDVACSASGWTGHAPQVLRDTTQEYVDFLFVNRRGAVETCSGLMKEAMNIDVSTTQYARVERPKFSPSRSLMAVGTDGRRSWSMSSGYVTREWAEWWTMEFLGGKRKQWWMKYKGPGMSAATFVPVVVKPAKSSTGIYDRSKQSMPHVDFTVTLALEG